VRPIVVELDTILPGPPDVVWELITDWENQDLWMREASDFVVTTPHREGIGVEAAATIRVGGLRTRDTIRVDVWEPARRLGIEHGGWVKGRGDLTLERSDGHTRFHWREELRPPWRLLGAIGLRAYRPLLARTFRRDLELLRELVEKRNVP
jgi:hypothetical protein